MQIYTLGYQGLSINEYVSSARAAKVGVVLDVRENAWSYRPDYVKSTLAGALAVAGINYIHVSAAGNPAEIRRTAATAEECLSRYRVYLNEHPERVGELYSYVRLAYESGRPACLTCYEHAPHECHRSVLVEALIELDPRIEPIHLPIAPQPVIRQRPSVLKTAFVAPQFLPIAGIG
jgi:uncharacterized protein (DUF488 family)